LRIGLLSDTHMPARGLVLPEPVFAAFEGVSAILHAGDLNRLEMLDPLAALAAVHAVAGNTDGWDVKRVLSRQRTLSFDGLTVGLTHGDQGSGSSSLERALSHFPQADVVVFGHSHRPLIERRGRVLLINPGSPTDKRGLPTFSCAVLTITDGQATAELVTW
jgi:hypothetical protein